MIPKCNFHTHTIFCDGKNTAEEMVLSAIGLGCEVLGFSGHSPMEGEKWCMSEQEKQDYMAEIARLREKYCDRLEIYMGLEYDVRSVCDVTPFEYVIGSVHYVEKDGYFIPVDMNPDVLKEDIVRYYGGDMNAFAEDYFANMYTLSERTHCQIVGHFDLLTKFGEKRDMFDISSDRYRRAAIDALDHLLSQDLIFEINTGAMARGHRTTPYPADFLLKRIVEKGGRVMLNSDAHLAQNILFGFESAAEFAKNCGVKELTIIKDGNFVSRKI